MQEAERALQNGADTIPEEVRRRFFSADKLTDKDRDAVLQVAGEALAPFLTGSEPEP
jgi:F-type H+-transporting ATPase subunit alpha